ncbi:condensation domain-containing protein [Gordonia shandongensis]|uniref:condensation domain-containing protein n=1 Tax=Gordonia shandongensis TaxID=376351 RepID=UPI0004204FD5|nr:condensation domain-containing protein [Gordonia shandongensis]
MDFLQILDAPIEPGGLVEWIPTVPGGLGSWRRDPRETSHNHEQHLRSAFEYRVATRREGGRESWLGVAIDFAEPMSVPAIRAALSAYIDRHEVLRTHVVLKADRDAHYRTERYTADPDTVHVTMSRIGWYTETALLLEQIAGSFDRATAPLHWPAYRFATVARPDGFTLLFAADHSLVDGYSLVTAHYELTELYRSARDRRPSVLGPPGSYLDFSDAQRREADAGDASHPAIGVWREFLDRYRHALLASPLLDHDPTEPALHDEGSVAVDIPDITVEIPDLTDDVTARIGSDPLTPDELSCRLPQPSRTALILDDAAARRLEDFCAAAGASLVGGVIGALALSFRSTTGAREFACIMPRHTRTDRTWIHSLGWFVGLAPLAVDVSDDPALAEAARRSTAALGDSRDGATLPFLRVAEILDVRSSPSLVVSYMDTRSTPRSDVGDAGAARVLRSHAYADDEVYIWVNRTPGGLRMHTRYPAGDGLAMEAFLDGFVDLLASTAKDG